MDDPSAFFAVLDRFCSDLDVVASDFETAAKAEQAALNRAGHAASRATAAGLGGVGEVGRAFADRARGAMKMVGRKRPAPISPLKRRDHMLATIRAYAKLDSNLRKTLLTEQVVALGGLGGKGLHWDSSRPG
jgi:hypothetical protein